MQGNENHEGDGGEAYDLGVLPLRSWETPGSRGSETRRSELGPGTELLGQAETADTEKNLPHLQLQVRRKVQQLVKVKSQRDRVVREIFFNCT